MQWLEDVQADSPSTTQLGNRFAQKILRDWLEIDEATAEVILCDGAGDGGIDAAVFVKADPAEGIDGTTWILVQSKYGTALSGPNTITLEAQKPVSYTHLDVYKRQSPRLATPMCHHKASMVHLAPKHRVANPL